MRDRSRWIAGVRQDPNHRIEQFGSNAAGLRDGSGKIVDIEYKTGDVRFRSFRYDEQGNVLQMILASNSQGVQIWNRRQDGKFYNQFGNRHDGDILVDQGGLRSDGRPGNAGNVIISEASGRARTYSPAGQYLNGSEHESQQSRFAGERQPSHYQHADQAPDRNEQVEPTYGQIFGTQQITDKVNYRDNLWDAAAAKKPVVMTFYRSGDPQSGQVVRALQQAKQMANGQAEFMAVDLDRVDPNSPIGQYAHRHIGQNFGTPLIMVFTQSQGTERTPVVPDKPMHHQRGNCNPEILLQAIGQAVEIQQQRDIRIPPSHRHPGDVDRPPAPTDNLVPPQPQPRPTDNLVPPQPQPRPTDNLVPPQPQPRPTDNLVPPQPQPRPIDNLIPPQPQPRPIDNPIPPQPQPRPIDNPKPTPPKPVNPRKPDVQPGPKP